MLWRWLWRFRSHVPQQGDCNTCPTRVTCQAHELGGGGSGRVDIEDVGREVKIEVPKEARAKPRRSHGRAGAKTFDHNPAS